LIRRRLALFRSSAAALVLAAGMLVTFAAGAQQRSLGNVDERKLLEPERAFSFSVRGLDPKTIEARFAVADGYYLYRDKLKFTVERATLAEAPTLPAGKMKQDEFFGTVETYRGELVVRLPLDKPAPGAAVDVVAESQGCADVGVCYPMQRQRLTLALPAAGAGPGAVVEAAPAKRSFFK
jgi:thiol:disulfide interchange protein DsbD